MPLPEASKLRLFDPVVLIDIPSPCTYAVELVATKDILFVVAPNSMLLLPKLFLKANLL